MKTQSTNQRTSLLTKGVGFALATMLLLAPGAAAVGALDATGTLSGSGRVTGDLDGTMDTVLAAAETLEATAESAIASTGYVNADIDVTADIDADVSGAASGAAGAGTGFVATAEGYVRALLDGIKGFFSSIRTSTNAEIDATVEASDESKKSLESDVSGLAELGAAAEGEARWQADTAFAESLEEKARLESGVDAGFADTIDFKEHTYEEADYQADAKATYSANAAAYTETNARAEAEGGLDAAYDARDEVRTQLKHTQEQIGEAQASAEARAYATLNDGRYHTMGSAQEVRDSARIDARANADAQVESGDVNGAGSARANGQASAWATGGL